MASFTWLRWSMLSFGLCWVYKREKPQSLIQSFFILLINETDFGTLQGTLGSFGISPNWYLLCSYERDKRSLKLLVRQIILLLVPSLPNSHFYRSYFYGDVQTTSYADDVLTIWQGDQHRSDPCYRVRRQVLIFLHYHQLLELLVAWEYMVQNFGDYRFLDHIIPYVPILLMNVTRTDGPPI